MDITFEVYELRVIDPETVHVGLRQIVTHGGMEQIGGYIAVQRTPATTPVLFTRLNGTLAEVIA